MSKSKSKQHVVENILLEGTSPKDVKKIFERATPEALDKMIEKYPYHQISQHEIDEYTSAIAAVTMGDETKERFYRRWKQETFANGHDSDIPSDGEVKTLKHDGKNIKYIEGRDILWCAQCEEPITVQKGDLKRYCDECEEPLEALTGPYRFFELEGTKPGFIPRKLAQNILGEEHIITIGAEEDPPRKGTVHLWKGNHYQVGVSQLDRIIREKLGDEWRSNRRKETVEFIKGETYTDPSELDKNTYRIALKNVGYDLRKNETCDITPDEMNTIQVPIEYDEDAEAKKFKEYLDNTLREDNQKRILEYMGLLLIKGNPFNKIMMCMGSGGNGRSTLFKIIKNWLGEKNVTSMSPEKMNENHVESGLAGKLAILNPDIPSKPIDRTSLLKMISGDDDITVNPKHRSPYELDPMCTAMFAANDLPPIEEKNRSIYRRLNLMQFPFMFVESEELAAEDEYFKVADPHIEEDIINDPKEMAGIFNLVSDHLADFMERDGNLLLNERTPRKTKELYIYKSEPILRFIEEYAEPADDDAFVERAALRKVYNRWAREYEERTFSEQKWPQQKTVEENLTEGWARTEDGRKRVYRGIRILEEELEVDVGGILDNHAVQSV